jgi:hypothetical protein
MAPADSLLQRVSDLSRSSILWEAMFVDLVLVCASPLGLVGSACLRIVAVGDVVAHRAATRWKSLLPDSPADDEATQLSSDPLRD